jgi:hypothetical protein
MIYSHAECGNGEDLKLNELNEMIELDELGRQDQ